MTDQKSVTVEELLAKAAAEAAALAKGIAAPASEAISQIAFWPNQVVVSLLGLVIIVLILLPQKLYRLP